MATITAFHSADEEAKPGQKRMHHTNDSCTEGQKIAAAQRQESTGGYRRCVDCSRMDEIEALRAAAAR